MAEDDKKTPWWAFLLGGLLLGAISSCSVTLTSKLGSIEYELRALHRLEKVQCRALPDKKYSGECY